MSEYDGYDQPTHDEPTADYPPADQYDNLIGQPLDGGFDAPHEQSVGGFTANDGYGPDNVNYEGGDQPTEYGAGEGYGEGAEAPAYAGAEGQHDPAYAGGDQHDPAYAGGDQHDPAYAGGDQGEGYAGGDQPAGYGEGEPNYAADGAEYAQPTQGSSGTSAQ